MNYTYADITKKLSKCGFIKDREGKGSHELWANPATGQKLPIPRHGSHTLSKGVIKKIIFATGLSNEQFHIL
ncbi:MAG: type II toxin-antitoxin system HicA family toxin [Candidatus Absconditabacterales bacterium]